MTLDAKHDICTYLVLKLVNKTYSNDPFRENEIIVYRFKFDKWDG